MIRDLDITLERYLTTELSAIAGCPIRSSDQITFDAPGRNDDTDGSKARINLHLLDLRESLTRREESFRSIRNDRSEKGVKEQLAGKLGQHRSPVYFDLFYLVTAHAADVLAQHELLANALRVLLRYRTLPPNFTLSGELAGVPPTSVLLSVAQQEHPAHADPLRLWQALGGALRPAIGLIVTLPFDPFETKWTKFVREAVFGMGVGTPPDGPNAPLEFNSIRVCVAGVVVDNESGNPLAEVTLTLEGRDETAQTDERGFFAFLDLPPGTYRLKARHRAYHPSEKATEFDVAANQRAEQLALLEVKLEPCDDTARAAREANDGSHKHGRGKAEPHSKVTLAGKMFYAPKGEDPGGPIAFLPVQCAGQTVYTDKDGYYQFLDLDAKTPPEISVELPGYGEIRLSQELIPSPSKPSPILLPPGRKEEKSDPPPTVSSADSRKKSAASG